MHVKEAPWQSDCGPSMMWAEYVWNVRIFFFFFFLEKDTEIVHVSWTYVPIDGLGCWWRSWSVSFFPSYWFCHLQCLSVVFMSYLGNQARRRWDIHEMNDSRDKTWTSCCHQFLSLRETWTSRFPELTSTNVQEKLVGDSCEYFSSLLS